VIAIDSSALLAVLLSEPEAAACEECLIAETSLLISAATLTEVMIVADRRGVAPALEVMLQALAPTVVPVTPSLARLAADAYRLWGRGNHAAALNFGDTFSYALAKQQGCPLLYVGDDFALTDIRNAMG